MDLFLLLIVVFVGLCFGSLVNAVVWRIHEQMQIDASKQKNKKQAKKRYSIVMARSMCPHCGHELGAKDLVPVFSWLCLRGKCRYCQAPISAQYPIVEMIGAIAAVISYFAWPYGLMTNLDIVCFGLWLVLLTILLALSVYDIRYYLLPNRLVLPATIVASVMIVGLGFAQGKGSFVVDALLGGLLFAGLFYGLYKLSRERWIGGGDVKLAFLLGLLAGSPLAVVLLLFIASVLGTLYAVIVSVVNHRPLTGSSKVPFGPWLITAGYIAFLLADAIMRWYGQLIVPV